MSSQSGGWLGCWSSGVFDLFLKVKKMKMNLSRHEETPPSPPSIHLLLVSLLLPRLLLPIFPVFHQPTPPPCSSSSLFFLLPPAPLPSVPTPSPPPPISLAYFPTSSSSSSFHFASSVFSSSFPTPPNTPPLPVASAPPTPSILPFLLLFHLLPLPPLPPPPNGLHEGCCFLAAPVTNDTNEAYLLPAAVAFCFPAARGEKLNSRFTQMEGRGEEEQQRGEGAEKRRREAL